MEVTYCTVIVQTSNVRRQVVGGRPCRLPIVDFRFPIVLLTSSFIIPHSSFIIHLWLGSAPLSSETSATAISAATRALFSRRAMFAFRVAPLPVSYTHLRAHETPEHLVCRL